MSNGNAATRALDIVLWRNYHDRVLAEKNPYKRVIKINEFENMVKRLPKTSRILSLVKNISEQRHKERNRAARTIQSAVRRTVLPRAVRSPLKQGPNGDTIPRSKLVMFQGEPANARQVISEGEKSALIWNTLTFPEKRNIKKKSGFVGGLLKTENANVNAVVREMHNIGVNINKRDYKGYAPLHYAVMNGGAALVKRLLDMGANPNVQSVFFKERPLHLAVKAGKIPVIKVLLEYGANPMAKDDGGSTPFTFAVKKEVLNALHRN